jgi:hypothetical protein
MTRRKSNKKKRNTIKKGNKTQCGGIIPKIKELIFSNEITTVLVDFDDVKLECKFGEQKLIIGKDIVKYCVL